MYLEPWVQKLIQQITQLLQAQAEAGWLEIDPSTPQRVLDYACGNGTVSGVMTEIMISQYKSHADQKNPGAP